MNFQKAVKSSYSAYLTIVQHQSKCAVLDLCSLVCFGDVVQLINEMMGLQDSAPLVDIPREEVKDYVAMLLHCVLHSLLDAVQAP